MESRRLTAIQHADQGWLPASAMGTSDPASFPLERLTIAALHGDPLALDRILRGCAALASASGDTRRAVTLLTAADAIAHDLSGRFPCRDAHERTDSNSRLSSSEELAAQRWNLTQREYEVLTLLGQRRTDAEIATALSISRRTASAHVGSIMSKLSANNRRDAVAIALGHRPW